MNSLNVKRGDTVIVLTGKDSGKKGKVLTANPSKETVTVEGINIVTKHVKPRGAQKPGGMQKVPGNTHVSNVMLVCPSCSKTTRIAHTIIEEDGKKKSVRTCKKCGAFVDKAAKASDAKKAVKKTAKAEDTAADTKKKPAKKVKKTEDASTAPEAAKAEKPKKTAEKPAEQTEKAEDKA